MRSDLPLGWRWMDLGELSADVRYGYTASATDEHIGPKFLRITDIVNGPPNWDHVPYCSIGDDELDRYRLHDGDIVIARTGASAGVSAYCSPPSDAVFASYLVRFRIDPSWADPRFVGHVLGSPSWREFVAANSAGSAQPQLNASVMRTFELAAPPLAEQTCIASVLGALDDKIDSNRRLAALLEEAAATIFRARFVDFVGVEKFEHSEIGQIPIGWKSGAIRDLARLRYGKALKAADRVPGSVAVVGSSGVVGAHTGHIVEGPSIVIGRKGTAGSVIWVRSDSWPIDTTFFAEPVEGVNPIFLYVTLLHANLPKLTENSGVPGLSRDAAERHSALVPSRNAVDEFASVAEPLFRQRDRLIQGVETLAALRDALLPKLTSGQIRVPVTDEPEGANGPVAEQLVAGML